MNNFQVQLDNIINRGRNVDRGMAEDVRIMLMRAYDDFQLVVNSVGLRAQVDIYESENNIFEDVIELMVDQVQENAENENNLNDSESDSGSEGDSESEVDSDSGSEGDSESEGDSDSEYESYDDGEDTFEQDEDDIVQDDPMTIDELEVEDNEAHP